MPEKWFRNVLDVILVTAAVVAAYVAWMQWQEKGDLEANMAELRQDLDSVQTQLEGSEELVRNQQARLQRSLDSFAKHYRTKVRAGVDSIAAYEDFDTPSNQLEFGDGFDAAQARRLKTVRRDLIALVEHVKDWRPVLDAFRETVNGQIDELEGDIARNDVPEMLEQFATIQKNLESKIDLLNSARELAAQSR